MNFAENRGCCVTVYREMTETMREEERVKKQISRCIKMLFLGIIMCLGMALSVHADSGQFFNFEPEKWDKEGFSWTDSKGQIWNAYEYGTKGEAFISSVDKATSMELQFPSVVYKNGVAKKVIGVGYCDPDKTNPYEAYYSFTYGGKSSDYMLYKVILPDSVCCVLRDAFYNHRGIAAIQLPQNPTLSIGYRAFAGCTNLQIVYFNAAVGSAQPVKIDEWAFLGCDKLEEITLPPMGAYNEIDGEAFKGCVNLKRIYNAPSYLDMGDEQSVEEVSFAEGLTYINGIDTTEWTKWDEEGEPTEGHMVNIKTLKKVTLPSTLKEIGSETFTDNKNLTTINLPDGLTRIGSYAFKGCTALTGFTSLPASVSGGIEDAAFMGCKNLHLENVYIHGTDSLHYQFADSGIVSIRVGSDVKSIWDGSFKGCTDLQSITVDAGNSIFFSKDGILYDKVYKTYGGEVIGNNICCYPAGKSWAGSYTLPSDVFLLSGFAFDSCKFTEIHIPARVLDLDRASLASLGDHSNYYAFDSIKDSCKLYVVRNSYVDNYFNDRYTFYYEDGDVLPITYDLDGGTNNSSNPSTFVGGNSISLSNPTREGYTFDYWMDWYEDKIENPYTPTGSELVNGVKFYAHWTKNPEPTKAPEPT